MFRRLFQSSQHGNGSAFDDEGDSNINEVTDYSRRVPAALPAPSVLPKGAAPGAYVSFETIYRAVPSLGPQGSYNIMKVAAMLKSSHMAGMSMDTKRAALMMALEAANAEIKDILQDAMLRQRALDDYEEKQLKGLREFEAAKQEENQEIQAELDAVTAQYMARIQANVDQTAQQQDAFRNWQKLKQQEAAVIADATAYCTANEGGLDKLTVALERTNGRR